MRHLCLCRLLLLAILGVSADLLAIAAEDIETLEDPQVQVIRRVGLDGVDKGTGNANLVISGTGREFSRNDVHKEFPYLSRHARKEEKLWLREKDEHGKRDYSPTGNYTDEQEGASGESLLDNCTHPRQPLPQYNDSCTFVHAVCEGKAELINYLALILCDLPKAEPFGYIVMAVWLIYLISLLATTVNHFFVPPLNYLSEKLHLSPSVAGVTLMALGNSAPDIFVVFSGVIQEDLALVLGSLAGAGIFITSVVLGTVMLASKIRPYNIDKIDFMRDIIALMVVVGTVIGVAFDGAVYLVEACIFPLIYVLYIAGVIGMGYFRSWIAQRSKYTAVVTQDPSQAGKTCSVTVTLCDEEKGGGGATSEIPTESVQLEKIMAKSEYSLSCSASWTNSKTPAAAETTRRENPKSAVASNSSSLSSSSNLEKIPLTATIRKETSMAEMTSTKKPLAVMTRKETSTIGTGIKLGHSLRGSVSERKALSTRQETSIAASTVSKFEYLLGGSATEKKFLISESKKKKETSLSSEEDAEDTDDRPIPYLPGLSWPKGSHIVIKIIWLIHWPFSLLRWLTIPSFYHDNYWSVWHYILTSFSPLPIVLLLLITAKGWKGFTLQVGLLPLPVFLVLIAFIPSLLLFVLLRPHRPPRWPLQLVLVPLAFIMAIIWLNIIANEVVSVLRAFGLLLTIDTAILGLTILAVGNCVADWVADTVVTRAGKPEMAFASCFGSPLLSHVLGLSLAMIVKIGIYHHGEPFRFHIHTSEYSPVKISWIFLGISLLGSGIIFPLFKFSPPRLYGAVLIVLYLIFVVVAVLAETNVLPINL